MYHPPALFLGDDDALFHLVEVGDSDRGVVALLEHLAELEQLQLGPGNLAQERDDLGAQDHWILRVIVARVGRKEHVTANSKKANVKLHLSHLPVGYQDSLVTNLGSVQLGYCVLRLV